MNPKMLPGQLPYSKEELEKLYKLVAEVAEAEEEIPIEVLEEIK